MITTSQMFLATAIALDVMIVIMAIREYGNYKYNKGRLSGFKDCANIQDEEMKNILDRLKAIKSTSQQNATDKTKAKS